jgi:hypothetical protein
LNSTPWASGRSVPREMAAGEAVEVSIAPGALRVVV